MVRVNDHDIIWSVNWYDLITVLSKIICRNLVHMHLIYDQLISVVFLSNNNLSKVIWMILIKICSKVDNLIYIWFIRGAKEQI